MFFVSIAFDVQVSYGACIGYVVAKSDSVEQSDKRIYTFLLGEW